MESIPDRESNAGPRSATAEMDWRDYLYEAEEAAARARRAETCPTWMPGQSDIRNRKRLDHIQAAMDALQAAKELLCR